MPTIAHGRPTGRLMSAAVKAATDAVRGFDAEKMAWMYDCVQSMPMTTDEKFARMWPVSPCSRLKAPAGRAAAMAAPSADSPSNSSELKAISPIVPRRALRRAMTASRLRASSPTAK